MQKKSTSLLIILFIYIIALAVGAIVAIVLKKWIENTILLLLVSDIAATIVVFIANLIFKNASVYDPYWSVLPPFIAIGYYYFSKTAFNPLHLIVLLPLLIWAIRLTVNWAIGFDNLKWEDWRYKKFKTDFPRISELIVFTGIMFFPTLIVFAGMIPFFYLITGPINLLYCIISGFIILIATFMQAISDIQLKRFKKQSTDKSALIYSGLWKYSRHPNYFGEIMVWIGLFVSCLANFAYITLLGPVSMILLFYFISVPLMEKHILKTRPHYVDYKSKVKNTIIILPRF